MRVRGTYGDVRSGMGGVWFGVGSCGVRFLVKGVLVGYDLWDVGFRFRVWEVICGLRPRGEE